MPLLVIKSPVRKKGEIRKKYLREQFELGACQTPPPAASSPATSSSSPPPSVAAVAAPATCAVGWPSATAGSQGSVECWNHKS